MSLPYISIVVPVFNEEDNLHELHRRLRLVLDELGRTWEMVFVDDGSRDGSLALLEALHADDPRVRALSFSRNFGHHIALTAGMDAARGEVVVFMDADLQDQPEAIPVLHAKLEEGYDVVYGERTAKKHSLFKRVTSSVFVWLMNRIVAEGHAIDTHVFRMARRPVIDAVKECREQARFVVGLISWVGFRQVGVEVPHGERHAGETKYSLLGMLRLAANIVTAFSVLPLRLATYLGVTVSFGAFAYGGGLIVKKLVWDTAVEGWTSTMVILLFTSGIQLFSLGVLGEYIGRIYRESQHRPLYVVARRLDPEDP